MDSQRVKREFRPLEQIHLLPQISIITAFLLPLPPFFPFFPRGETNLAKRPRNNGENRCGSTEGENKQEMIFSTRVFIPALDKVNQRRDSRFYFYYYRPSRSREEQVTFSFVLRV